MHDSRLRIYEIIQTRLDTALEELDKCYVHLSELREFEKESPVEVLPEETDSWGE